MFKRIFIWLFCIVLGLAALGIGLIPFVTEIVAGGSTVLSGYTMLTYIWWEGFTGPMSAVLQVLALIMALGMLLIGIVGMIREFVFSPVPEIKKGGVILALSYTLLNLIMMILLLVMCFMSRGNAYLYEMGIGVYIATGAGLLITILLLVLIKVLGDTTVWTRRARTVAPSTIYGSAELPPAISYGKAPVTSYGMMPTPPAAYGIAPPAAPVNSYGGTQTVSVYGKTSVSVPDGRISAPVPASSSYGLLPPANAPVSPGKKRTQIKTQIVPDTGVNFRFIEGMSEKQVRAAVEDLFAKASRGDADAQFRLGICYQNGTGLPVDIGRAAEWMQKASAQGHPQAKFVLGEYYIEGKGVPRKIVDGITLIKESAAKGFVGAQMRLGAYYQNGEFLPKDYEKAVRWFTKAAEQGNEYSIAALKSFEKGADGKWRLKQ